jgi:hypothetical protein
LGFLGFFAVKSSLFDTLLFREPGYGARILGGVGERQKLTL